MQQSNHILQNINHLIHHSLSPAATPVSSHYLITYIAFASLITYIAFASKTEYQRPTKTDIYKKMNIRILPNYSFTNETMLQPR